MAHKIVTDTAVYTEATRTLSGMDTISPAGLVAADVGKTVVWRVDTSVFHGRIASVLSAASAQLHEGGDLPAADQATIPASAILILDQGEAHAYQDYIDQVKTLTQDDKPALTDSETERLLGAAVTDYGEDSPFKAAIEVTGNGTKSYVLSTILGSYWKPGYTIIHSVEYPSANNPPTMLDADDWEVYDDGSEQDGSNVVLRFPSVTPAASEKFVVTFRLQPSLPSVGSQNFPDTESHFSNITLLAAAYSCFALASSYALSTDSTIAGDSFNYADKVDRYIKLGKLWLGRYNASVFGAEEPTTTVASATAIKTLERRASNRGNYLFH